MLLTDLTDVMEGISGYSSASAPIVKVPRAGRKYWVCGPIVPVTEPRILRGDKVSVHFELSSDSGVSDIKVWGRFGYKLNGPFLAVAQRIADDSKLESSYYHDTSVFFYNAPATQDTLGDVIVLVEAANDNLRNIIEKENQAQADRIYEASKP
jgi:hypothetical protein